MRAAASGCIRHRVALCLWHLFFFQPFHIQAHNLTTAHIVPAAMRHTVVVFAAAAQCHEIAPFEEGVLQRHVQNIPLRDRFSYPARHFPGKGGWSGAKATNRAISICQKLSGEFCDVTHVNYMHTPNIYIYICFSFLYWFISFFLLFLFLFICFYFLYIWMYSIYIHFNTILYTYIFFHETGVARLTRRKRKRVFPQGC